jgi:aminoglycoside phosphotransferase (APT) family kinase protein
VIDNEQVEVDRMAAQAELPVIDFHLARRLVDRQFPQWTDLPIAPVELDGIDNRTFRLGDKLTVRLPSGEWYARQVDKEQRWLPLLAPRLWRLHGCAAPGRVAAAGRCGRH